MTSTFEARIDRILNELGIPRASITCPMHEEAPSVVSLGEDCLGREQFATPQTALAWAAMREAARRDGIVLDIVSAFRSVDYQCELIRNKLADGRDIADIMKVNAAPGFSEHHTGRALDLCTPGCELLTEAFEQTAAFAWLNANAGKFGFHLSYPRDNPFGFDYEPWHWAYREEHSA